MLITTLQKRLKDQEFFFQGLALRIRISSFAGIATHNPEDMTLSKYSPDIYFNRGAKYVHVYIYPQGASTPIMRL